MLKKLFILIFSFVFFASFTSLFAQKASYIEQKVQSMHSKDGSYDVWAKSKHATGFKTLQNEESKKISKVRCRQKRYLFILSYITGE